MRPLIVLVALTVGCGGSAEALDMMHKHHHRADAGKSVKDSGTTDTCTQVVIAACYTLGEPYKDASTSLEVCADTCWNPYCVCVECGGDSNACGIAFNTCIGLCVPPAVAPTCAFQCGAGHSDCSSIVCGEPCNPDDLVCLGKYYTCVGGLYQCIGGADLVCHDAQNYSCLGQSYTCQSGCSGDSACLKHCIGLADECESCSIIP